MENPNPGKKSFRQSLGLFDATMIVVGSMIGSGIFVVSADISRTLGSPFYMLLTWLITGVITIIAGLFILRKTRPDAERPYKAFGYPVLPALYIILALALCIDLLIYKPDYTWPGIIIVLIGIPAYFLMKRASRQVGTKEHENPEGMPSA